jgi:hypothetical protein
MASNTRKAAHRREEDTGDTESNTEGVVSWSRLVSELAVSRAREGNSFCTPLFPNRGNGPSGDTIKPNADSIVKKNEIENYIELI